MANKEKLQKEMFDKIRAGGAWFCMGTDRYTKIGYSRDNNCYFARECFFRDEGLEGGAYSFGTDWFDISIKGSHVDIYADADTFKRWDIEAKPESSDDKDDAVAARGLIEFCRDADAEALTGIDDAYRISSTNFDAILAIRAGL